MDFTYDDDQLALQEVARSALERECGPDLLRRLADEDAGITPELWSTLVDLGWTGLLVPEEQGGTGSGLLELCIVAEQMGRVPVPGPFFSSAVAATLARARPWCHRTPGRPECRNPARHHRPR